MLKNNLLNRLCALLLSFTCFTHAAQLPGSFHPAKHTQYYRYPVPRQQFTFPASKPSTQQQFQRQQQQPQQQYISYSQQYKQHYAQQQTRSYQQQQQNQYQQYRTQSSQTVNSYYQQPSINNINNNNVLKQFASPALENAAFTTALTSQGYNFGGIGGARGVNNPATASISSARALPAASSLSLIAAEAVKSDNSNDIGMDGSIDLTDSSINLKLPLPVNIAPIKVSPLPLQAGASFSELAKGVTSYGTVYPQRKRR